MPNGGSCLQQGLSPADLQMIWDLVHDLAHILTTAGVAFGIVFAGLGLVLAIQRVRDWWAWRPGPDQRAHDALAAMQRRDRGMS
jgi:hypothetical protein